MFRLACSPPKEIVVAISGGCDSVAAAHWLRRKHKVSLYHYHHATTQADSFLEAVTRFACDFNLPLTVRKTYKKLTTEAEFRAERIKYYLENELDVVTGHNLNEATESYAHDFMRGHSWKIPMKIVNKLGPSTIYRPFIITPKERLRDYIAKQGLEKYVVEDLSNTDVKHRRNWIRHSLIPLVESQKIGLRKIVLKKYLNYLSTI